MLIKHINKNLFDVFINNGWENWERYNVVNNNGVRSLNRIAGEAQPSNVVNYLQKKVGIV